MKDKTVTVWFYVVYQDHPSGPKWLSSKHIKLVEAKIAVLRKQDDGFWKGYIWSIQTNKPE